MLVIAHRGASTDFPENTLLAFEGAVAQGADGVELDVRRTRDGALVVSHDDTLADGRVLVDTDMADLPEWLPGFTSALRTCRPLTVVNTEIKNGPDDKDFDVSEQLAAAVVAELTARGELDDGRHLISSFHLPTVDRVHALAPQLATAWLVTLVEDPGALIDMAARRGHVAIHPYHVFVSKTFVAQAHAAGLAVNTWTCDEPDRIKWLADLGVDAVVTNVPAIARQALS
ncbi:MAG: glycerophosphodiester phosphodiesterase [Acidimicrobiia bacterium]|nr:glycerophosphodiester phosphodiesterase [Acidimicrobiia bacterium]